MPETYIFKSSEMDINEATPMLKQYLDIKKNYQGVILFYRLGDFYETFFEDAVTASKELEITLTSREGGKSGRFAMAGVPAKAAETYISRLIEKGHKVAICEQVEDPALAKGIVERKVIKTYTAGTLTELNLLESTKNNYLAAIFKDKKSDIYGLAYIDISTGEFKVTQAEINQLVSELSRISPAEILAPVKKQEIKPFQIVPDEVADLPEVIVSNYNCTKISISSFSEEKAVDKIKKIFNVSSLSPFGYPEYKEGIVSAGAIIDYLKETQMDSMPKFDVIAPYSLDEYVAIDSSARRNLELVQTVRDGSYKGSLLWAINKTATNMGTRRLRKWLQQPLKSISQIKERQTAVEELMQSGKARMDLFGLLERVYDIERLATKISNNTANARDFNALKDSLLMIPQFAVILQNSQSGFLSVFNEYDSKLIEFAGLIEKTIAENPPVGVKEGGLIKSGVNTDLDRVRELLTGGRHWLEEFEAREKEKTGIKSLKVAYSKTFGYFIEVTHSNTSLVPEYYVRKQTLTNAERYITPELKEHEIEVLSAETRVIELEYKIFSDFREYAKEFVQAVRNTAHNLSALDVLLSFANCAIENNYTQPDIDGTYDLIVEEGRHPVIEQLLPMGQYVANNMAITGGEVTSDCQFMILTGPNMAGKSTYMRQNAIIAILGQIGSFVPAKYARIGIVDKIFTRVGAVDDLSTGQSTFMVEMNETAFILNSATARSFILLDEIGRGTSTYDGVAIAWSVAEYIAEKIKARTIFATHYHELNVMQEKYPQIANYRVTITENDGEIEFLHRVVPGGASKSYGIQVAKMAGLPSAVITRASTLMNKMQKEYSSKINMRRKGSDEDADAPQLSLF